MVSAAGGWGADYRKGSGPMRRDAGGGSGMEQAAGGGEPQTSRAAVNYTAARTPEPGAGSIVTGGNAGAFQRRCAHCQNPCTEAGGEGGAA